MNKIQNELVEFYRALMSDDCEDTSSRLEAANQLQNMTYQIDDADAEKSDVALAFINARAALLGHSRIKEVCQRHGLYSSSDDAWIEPRSRDQARLLREELSDDLLFNALTKAIVAPRCSIDSTTEDLLFYRPRWIDDSEPKPW